MTVNELPSAASGETDAWAVTAESRLSTKWCALLASVIRVAFHLRLEIEPPWPPAVTACAAVNVAEPKFANGSRRQSDGPSALRRRLDDPVGRRDIDGRERRRSGERLVPGEVVQRDGCRLADDGHRGANRVSGLDLHPDRVRWRWDQLVPDARDGLASRVAVGLAADLLERVDPTAESSKPDPGQRRSRASPRRSSRPAPSIGR